MQADTPADSAHVVDARGHRCPVPTLKLRRALERHAEVVLLADDPLARIDVPHLATEIGASCVLETGEPFLRFRVRRG